MLFSLSPKPEKLNHQLFREYQYVLQNILFLMKSPSWKKSANWSFEANTAADSRINCPQRFGLPFCMRVSMSKAVIEGHWFQSDRRQHFRAHWIFGAFTSISTSECHLSPLPFLTSDLWSANLATNEGSFSQATIHTWCLSTKVQPYFQALIHFWHQLHRSSQHYKSLTLLTKVGLVFSHCVSLFFYF